ncbi:hypothetical protein QYS46_04740 [Klebsiella michiganensis]|nr:hypothetical protein [Klebsiella michiganensis]
MADKLIRVNSRVSVMVPARWLTSSRRSLRIVSTFTCSMTRVEELEYSMRNERWSAKDLFEAAVNDALKGE